MFRADDGTRRGRGELPTRGLGRPAHAGPIAPAFRRVMRRHIYQRARDAGRRGVGRSGAAAGVVSNNLPDLWRTSEIKGVEVSND